MPGRLRSYRRYLRPRAWRIRRSVNSGAVSLLPTAAIIRERVASSTTSGIAIPVIDVPVDRRRTLPDLLQWWPESGAFEASG